MQLPVRILVLISFATALCALEYFLLKRKKKTFSFDREEAAASTFIFIVQAVDIALWTGFTLFLHRHIRSLAPYQIPALPFWAWFPAGLLVSDFIYYWTHRYLHQVRLGWLNHSVHHTPKFYNSSMAYRVGPGLYITLAGFFQISMMFLGVRPEWITVLVLSNKLYQFTLHTELDFKLGWLEKIFVTSSHHRVHHGKNPQYIDKNFGGVFIFYDKIFGTFQAEDPSLKIEYGVTENFDSRNFIQSTFGAWILLGKDLRKYPGLGNKIRLVFKPPGWVPQETSRPSPPEVSKKFVS